MSLVICVSFLDGRHITTVGHPAQAAASTILVAQLTFTTPSPIVRSASFSSFSVTGTLDCWLMRVISSANDMLPAASALAAEHGSHIGDMLAARTQAL